VGGAEGVGPTTSAHVPDCSQFRALAKHGPHTLGPLVANLVVVKAGVRPPTQSVTHTHTDKEKEATQGPTHKDEQVRIERDGPRQIHIHGRPVPTWPDHSEREREGACVCVIEEEEYKQIHLTHAHTHICIHMYAHASYSALLLSLSSTLMTAYTQTRPHTQLCRKHRDAHAHTGTHRQFYLSFLHTRTRAHTRTRTCVNAHSSLVLSISLTHAYTRASLSLYQAQTCMHNCTCLSSWCSLTHTDTSTWPSL
jgi:hypothetical protein